MQNLKDAEAKRGFSSKADAQNMNAKYILLNEYEFQIVIQNAAWNLQ